MSKPCVWGEILYLLDGLNRRLKEPGWSAKDRETVYDIKDQVMCKLLRQRPEEVSLSLYYVPYIKYSVESKDRAGAMMRADLSRQPFEYYLAQLPSSPLDVDVVEQATVEVLATCEEKTYSLHMPALLAAKNGVELNSLETKRWMNPEEFHHQLMESWLSRIALLLDTMQVDGQSG